MIINLSPQRRDDELEVLRNGNTLKVNGEVFDFSRMAEGDTLPVSAINSEWFIGQVDNINGELELTLILPLPINYSQAQAFPEPLKIVADGPVLFPEPLPLEQESTEELPNE